LQVLFVNRCEWEQAQFSITIADCAQLLPASGVTGAVFRDGSHQVPAAAMKRYATTLKDD
jgi:hypothetical protein